MLATGQQKRTAFSWSIPHLRCTPLHSSTQSQMIFQGGTLRLSRVSMLMEPSRLRNRVTSLPLLLFLATFGTSCGGTVPSRRHGSVILYRLEEHTSELQ